MYVCAHEHVYGYVCAHMCVCVCVSACMCACAHSEARPFGTSCFLVAEMSCHMGLVLILWGGFHCYAGSSAFLSKDKEGTAWAGLAAVVPHSCGFSSWTLLRVRRALKGPARSKPAGSPYGDKPSRLGCKPCTLSFELCLWSLEW